MARCGFVLFETPAGVPQIEYAVSVKEIAAGSTWRSELNVKENLGSLPNVAGGAFNSSASADDAYGRAVDYLRSHHSALKANVTALQPPPPNAAPQL